MAINLNNNTTTLIVTESSSQTNRQIRVYVRCSNDIKNNQSTLKWAIRVCSEANPTSSDGVLTSPLTLKINNRIVYRQEATGPTSTGLAQKFPAYVGYVSNDNWRDNSISHNGDLANKNTVAAISKDFNPIIIKHNNDGTKSIDVQLIASIYENPSNPESRTVTINLPAMDRTAPSIVNQGTSIASSNDGKSLSFTIRTSSTKSQYSIDRWEYSTNGGQSYSIISQAEGTSISNINVSGFNPGSEYSIILRVRDKDNHVYGQTTPITVTTNYGVGLQNISTLAVDLGASDPSEPSTIFKAIAKALPESGRRYDIQFGTGSGSGFSDLFTKSDVDFRDGEELQIKDITLSQMNSLLGKIASDKKSATATARLIVYSDSSGSTSLNTSDHSFEITTTSAGSALVVKDDKWNNIFFTALNKDDYVGEGKLITSEQGRPESSDDPLPLYFLKNYSDICAKIEDWENTIEFKNGSEFDKIEMTIGQIPRESSVLDSNPDKIFNFGKVGSYGVYDGKIRIYDSRGYSTSRDFKIHLRNYFSPSVTTSALSISRNSEGKFQIDIGGDKQFRGIISRKTNLRDPSAWNDNTINALYYRIRSNNETASGTWDFVDISGRIEYPNNDDSWYVNGNSPIILGEGTWQDSSPYYIDIFVADKCHGNLNVSWPNIPTNAFAYTSFSLPKDPLVAIRKGYINVNGLLKENGDGVQGLVSWLANYGNDGYIDSFVNLDDIVESGIYWAHVLTENYTGDPQQRSPITAVNRGYPQNISMSGQAILQVFSNKGNPKEQSKPSGTHINNIIQKLIKYNGTTGDISIYHRPGIYKDNAEPEEANPVWGVWSQEQQHSGGSAWNDILNKPFAGINGTYLDVLENDLTVDPAAIIYWLVHTSTNIFDKTSLANETEHIPSSSAVLYTLNQKLGDIQTVISQINSLIGG